MNNGLNAVKKITIQAVDLLTVPARQMQKSVGVLDRTLGLMVRTMQFSGGVVNGFVNSLVGLYNFTLSLPDNFNRAIAAIEKFNLALSGTFKNTVEQKGILSDLGGVGGGALLDIIQGLGGPVNQIRAQVGRIPTEVGQKVATAVNLVDAGLLRMAKIAASSATSLTKPLTIVATISKELSGVAEPIRVFGLLKNVVSQVSGKIFLLTQQIAFFSLGMQALQQLVHAGPFKTLIFQNIELRDQLLSTQALLSGTADVFRRGFEVTDPTEAIRSLEGPVKQAITDLRKESLDLVGVTSKELVPIFQLAAGQIASLGGGLNEAKDLTISFAATLGTLGVPLFQARQEISSILQGTIDMNSVVAKSLNINNEMVAKWKSQGVAISKLQERLASFVAGNALAAKNITGVWSNIVEVFDEIGRTAGEQLIEPIVEVLENIYENVLRGNQAEIVQYFTDLVGQVLAAVTVLGGAFQKLGDLVLPILKEIPKFLGRSLLAAFKQLAIAVGVVEVAARPFITILGKLAPLINSLTPVFAIFIQAKVAELAIKGLTGSFGLMMQILPGAGELLYILGLRTNSVAGSFLGMQKVVGPGIAAFLALSQNAGFLNLAIGKLSSAVPLLGPMLAAHLPMLSRFGIGLTGLYAKFPIAQELMGKFSGSAQNLLIDLSKLADSKGMPELSRTLFNMSENTNIATVANRQLSVSIQGMAKTIGIALLKFALIGGVLFGIAVAFNKFILQNKELMLALDGVVKGIGAFAHTVKNVALQPMTLFLAGVTAIAFAMYSQMIPALVAAIVQLKVMAGTMLINVATNLLGLAVTIQGMGLVTFGANLQLIAAGLLKMGVAAFTGSGGLAAFALGLKSIAAGFLAIAGPVVAVTGLLAIFALTYRTMQIKDELAGFEIRLAQANNLQKDAMDTASELFRANERANKAKKTGIGLTEAEFEQNKKLSAQAKSQIQDLEAQIKAQEAAKNAATDEGVIRGYESSINGLNQTLEFLKKQSNAVLLAQIPLAEIGDAFGQLEEKARSAQEAMDNPFGDPAIFKKKAQELIDTTNKQLEIGAISAREAASRMREMTSVRELEVDQQIAAFQALQKAETAYFDNSISELKEYQSQVNALSAAGRIDPIESERQAGKIRIALLEEEIDKEKTLLFNKQQFSSITQEAQEKALNKIETLKAQVIQAESEIQEKINSAEMAAIRRQESQIVDETKAAEQQRLFIIKEMSLERRKSHEIDEENWRSRRITLLEQIDLQENVLRVLEDQAALQNPVKEEQRQAQLRKEREKLGALSLSLIDNEVEAQKLATDILLRQIEARTEALKNAAQSTKNEFEAITRAVDAQQTLMGLQEGLLQSRQSLLGAIVQKAETEYGILLKTERTAKGRRRLADELAKIKLKAAMLEIDFEQRKLDLMEKQLKLSQVRETMALRLAEIEAKAALSEAIAKQESDNAKADTTDAQKRANTLGVQAATEKLDSFDLQRQILGLQQDAARQNLEVQKRMSEIQQQNKQDKAFFEFAEGQSDSDRGRNLLRKQARQIRDRQRDGRDDFRDNAFRRDSFQLPDNITNQQINIPAELLKGFKPVSDDVSKKIVPALQSIEKKLSRVRPIEIGGVNQTFENSDSLATASEARESVLAGLQDVLRDL